MNSVGFSGAMANPAPKTVETFKIHRYFSKYATRWLLRTPLTPNHITLISLGIGILSGYCFAQGGYWNMLFGAFWLQIAMILDCSDGEVARAKNLKTRVGVWLDVTCDTLVDIVIFWGIAQGLRATGVPGPIYPTLGLCIFGSIMNWILVVIQMRRGFGPAVFGAHHPDAKRQSSFLFRMAEAAGEGDMSWFVLAFALFGRMDWLFWSAGVYMQILWIYPVVVNFRWLFLKESRNEAA